jgi:membrane fusion protein, heavy metal efflux system
MNSRPAGLSPKFGSAAVIALAAAALLAACSGAPKQTAAPAAANPALITLPADQRAQIHLARVEQTPFHPIVSTTGTVAFDGDQSTQVLAPISGPVLRILVETGTHVSAGQPLALVASPDFAAAVAGFRKADAEAKNTRRIADLDEQLFKNDAIARRDMEQAETDAVSAAADREAALQQLISLSVDSTDIAALQEGQAVTVVRGVIRSPIEGTLVEKLITPGQLLSAGSTPCFTVADVSRMWVLGNVFESDLGDVARGDSADVTTSAAPTVFHGRIDYVADLVDPDTKATAVRITVPNPGRVLRKDMYVNVAIHSHLTDNGLLVPVSAVLRDEDNTPFVFVAQGQGGTFERRTVTLGPRIGDRYQIDSGLQAGEQVVSEGGLFLQFAMTQ